MLAQAQAIARPRGARCLPGPESGLKRFPFNNFTYFLTLFSKCFSSFDHSTCALSVSRRYLALDEIYHPLGAAFPNNSTRRRAFTREEAAGLARDSHPLRRPVPRNMGRRSPPKVPLQITTRRSGTPDFKFELLPLHSPLLGQSLLVSFPPLIDMLKFSGYPYLIRGVPMSRSTPPDGRARAGSLAAHERLCVISRSATRQASAHGFRRGGRRIGHATAAMTARSLARGFVPETLEQACPPECQGAQCAFKDSMIH